MLEQTMGWVAAADTGRLDYVVVDGGSSDGTYEFLESRRHQLAFLISEPDSGVYDAISKGFAATNGEIMGWINAGDYLFPDSLRIISEIFQKFPEVAWLTSRVHSFLDERGYLIEQGVHNGFARDSYLAGEHLEGFSKGRALSFVQQESTFWRRTLWEKAGGHFHPSLCYAADFELWYRFFQHAELWSLSAPIGAFRLHSDSLSRINRNDYLAEAYSVLRSQGIMPRQSIAQNLSVGLRRSLPRQLRSVATALRLFKPAPLCIYDRERFSWRLERC